MDSLVVTFFMIYGFKVFPCPIDIPHHQSDCPYYHSPTDRRRNPQLNPYSYARCKAAHDEYGRCAQEDDCPCAHSDLEAGLHPLSYRTQFCSFGAACSINPCFFAHSRIERRCPGYTIIPARLVSSAPIAFPNAPIAFPFGGTMDSPASMSLQRQIIQLQCILEQLQMQPQQGNN